LSKKETKTKNKWRTKYLEYLSDPENSVVEKGKVLTRGQIAKVLGTTRQTLYRHFTAAEMDELDADALAERRRRCARQSTAVDYALFQRATNGDPQAIKLFYERIEGWTPSQKIQVEPSLDEIRQMAIEKGFDPDKYINLYLSKKAEMARGKKS
jgi:hypothetical protein